MTVILYVVCCVHVYTMQRQSTDSDFLRDTSTETVFSEYDLNWLCSNLISRRHFGSTNRAREIFLLDNDNVNIYTYIL
jgi:hypothetical protein